MVDGERRETDRRSGFLASRTTGLSALRDKLERLEMRERREKGEPVGAHRDAPRLWQMRRLHVVIFILISLSSRISAGELKPVGNICETILFSESKVFPLSKDYSLSIKAHKGEFLKISLSRHGKIIMRDKLYGTYLKDTVVNGQKSCILFGDLFGTSEDYLLISASEVEGSRDNAYSIKIYRYNTAKNGFENVMFTYEYSTQLDSFYFAKVSRFGISHEGKKIITAIEYPPCIDVGDLLLLRKCVSQDDGGRFSCSQWTLKKRESGKYLVDEGWTSGILDRKGQEEFYKIIDNLQNYEERPGCPSEEEIYGPHE